MAQDSSVSSIDYLDTTVVSNTGEEDATHFILVGQKLKDSRNLHSALKELGLKAIYSDTGIDENLLQSNVAYVVDNFEGSIFSTLTKHKRKIFGPTAIIEYASKKLIPRNVRPVYCLSMEKIVVCFNGFRNKDELDKLAAMVHRMGGTIRRDLVAGVTHLISVGAAGEKYKLAVGKGVPIMSSQWITKSWEMKNTPYFRAKDLPHNIYRLSPFVSATLAFYGFAKEDIRHMEEVTIANGGSVVETLSPAVTHVVVNERGVRSPPAGLISGMHVVKAEWFWACIQMEARATESLYTFDFSGTTPSSHGRKTPNTPLSTGSKSKKRRRENLTHLDSDAELDLPACKRTSLDVLSRNNSFNDILAGNSLTVIDDAPVENAATLTHSPGNPKDSTLSRRQQTIMELYQTEKNYVGILETILKVFKEGIENTDQPGGAILNTQEVKTIFGGVPPIYQLHLTIKNKLMDIISNWDKDLSVGDVYLGHVNDILRVYPNFINYYEAIKEAITQCEKSKPRFHAFLKVCQSRAECERQTLTDLFIRLVQRLPSVGLLLRDIAKRTPESHKDHDLLNRAAEYLNNTVVYINEDKRKTEGHQAMLGLVNEIENAPPNLASSFRVLVTRLDGIDVSGASAAKGTHVALFVFTDSLEICKRRKHQQNSHRNSTVSINTNTSKSKKPYKHLAYVHFSDIRRIVEVCGNAPCMVFALIVKMPHKSKEDLFAFAVVNNQPPTINQTFQQSDDDLLTFLSKIICGHLSRSDYENFVCAVEASQLDLEIPNLNCKSAISKAASRVRRVLSINKTPAGLKRTISSITQLVSPMRRDASTATLQNPPSTSKNNENEQYSDIVDKVSIGTPSLQRRRETLASISMNVNTEQDQHRIKKNQSDGTFLTPLPIKGRAGKTVLSQVLPINLSKDFPPMKPLNFDSPNEPRSRGNH